MLDPYSVPSPSFVLEEEALESNLDLIARVRDTAEVTLIIALKGFAMFSAFPMIRRVTGGAAASSLFEARLAHEEFGGNVHCYAPVYLEREWEEVSGYASHVTFNSIAQYERFRSRCRGLSVGLRINPEYSPVETDLYNPCVPGSRLGIRADVLKDGLLDGIEGLHSHNLCESDSYALERTLENIERLYGHLLPSLKWLNLGGGHLMTRANYDVDHAISVLTAFRARHPGLEIILEPGAAFVWRTGVLAATVMDIVESGGIETAMLDTSFAAHMPDCLEMPYTPEIRGAIDLANAPHVYRMGGISCLAGDFTGPYGFEEPLKPGDRIVFEDMMHYTMVKTNMFNGINLPSIGIWRGDDTYEAVASFTYEDYRGRLS